MSIFIHIINWTIKNLILFSEKFLPVGIDLSGLLYIYILWSYLQRIGRADNGSCPECGGDEHTSSHIFNCPSHPTELTLSDLWVRPLEAAAFVASLGAFQDLPPLEDHPPPVPPEPPPAAGNWCGEPGNLGYDNNNLNNLPSIAPPLSTILTIYHLLHLHCRQF